MTEFKKGDIVQILPLPEGFTIGVPGNGTQMLLDMAKSEIDEHSVGRISWDRFPDGMVYMDLFRKDGSRKSIRWPDKYITHADFIHRIALDLYETKHRLEQIENEDGD